ncbi:MAG: thioredoxin fold domain-containing protein [Kangiellaceae bacterium]|jgi:thioredoxin-related protein|nr:thioredoxin fold domain-containing protein [Kangiellaceae bacterium]
MIKRFYLTALLIIIPVISLAEPSDMIDAQQLANRSFNEGKVLVFYIKSIGCPYCLKLEKDVIEPITINQGYQSKIILQHLTMGSSQEIRDFNGKNTSMRNFIKTLSIRAAPTLIFVDASGHEVAKRLEGYQEDAFYWHYLDRSIDQALSQIN